MKTRSFDADRAVALVCVLASLGVAVTCASASPPKPAAAPVSPLPTATTTATTSATAPLAPEPLAPLPVPTADGDAVPEPRPGLALPKFFAALAQLSAGKRERVRVLWLGDSHTAADFLPHAVRRPLQSRFGNGGPGFVSIGLDKYRHGALLVKSEGKWRREPQSPASGSRQKDGVFGLSGIRAVPESLDAKTKIELLSGAVAGPARWEIVFRASGDARAVARLHSGEEHRLDAGPGIRRVRFDSPPRATVTVRSVRGAPEFFGAFVESKSGGVVVDTLGINGARVSTALAWDASAFGEELRARAPELVVFAYGTNEAASKLRADRYVTQLETLVRRVRDARPGVDCLILGPPDMADSDGASVPRVPELDAAAKRAAESAGCAHFSLFEAMGGDGSMARWVAETPALAAPDRVHLTPHGYEKLGGALAQAILEAYDRSAQ